MLEKVIVQTYLDDIKSNKLRYEQVTRIENYIRYLEKNVDELAMANLKLREQVATLTQKLGEKNEQTN